MKKNGSGRLIGEQDQEKVEKRKMRKKRSKKGEERKGEKVGIKKEMI